MNQKTKDRLFWQVDGNVTDDHCVLNLIQKQTRTVGTISYDCDEVVWIAEVYEEPGRLVHQKRKFAWRSDAEEWVQEIYELTT